MKKRFGFRLTAILAALMMAISALPAAVIADETFHSTYTAQNGIELITGSDLRIVPAEGTEHAPYLYPGETMQLLAEPADTYTAASWESSDENVASIDGDGLVTAVSPGAVLVTVEEEHGYRQEYQVVVLDSETTYTITYRIQYPDDAFTYVFRKDDKESKAEKPQDASFTEEYKGLIPDSKVSLNSGDFVQTVNYELIGWRAPWGTVYGPGSEYRLSGNLELEAVFGACTLDLVDHEDKTNYYKYGSNYRPIPSDGLRYLGDDGREYFKFMVAANERLNFYYSDFKSENFTTKLLGFKLVPPTKDKNGKVNDPNKGMDQEYLDMFFEPGQLIDLPYRSAYYFQPVYNDVNVYNTVVVIRKKGTLSASYGYSPAYYYYVGQGMLTKDAADLIEAQDVPWGTKGIDGATDEKHYYSTNGYVGDANTYTTSLPEDLYYDIPDMQHILGAVGETVGSQDAYEVIWYKIGRTGKGYTLDGVLKKKDVSHVITVIDTVTGNIAGQVSVEDLAPVNLKTLAEGFKSSYTNFKYKGVYKVPTDDNSQAVKNETVSVDMDFTIYLVYLPKGQQVYHKVRFLDENGNDVYFEQPGVKGLYYQYLAHGASGEEAPHPVKEGYTFRGWYTERNAGGEKFSHQLDQVTQDWTFYAYFTQDLAELTIRKDAPALSEGNFDIRVYGFKPGTKIGNYTADATGAILLKIPVNDQITLTVPAGDYRVEEKLVLADAIKYEASYPGGNTVSLKAGDKATVTVVNKPIIRIEITGDQKEYVYDGTLKTASGYESACADALFDSEKISFSGTDSVSRIETGDYPMGLKEDDFGYTDDRVKAIFIIHDGSLKITPAPPAPETTLASVLIVWDDANDADRVRPEQVVATLIADGVFVDITTISAATGWRATFSGLPILADDVKIVYTWDADTPDEYTLVSNVTEGTNTTITFRHVVPMITLSVRKQWEDGNNANGTRPGNLTVYLTGNGIVYGTVTLSAENGWAASAQAPQRVNGQEVAYQWIEPAVNGYTADNPETDGTETVLTNRFTPQPPPANPDTNPDGGEETAIYTLTIFYEDTEGNQLALPVTGEYTAGEAYNVPSPVIDGYITLEPVVKGEMPARDLTHTVLYLKSLPGQTLVDIGEYETPLGLGDVYVNVGEAFE